MKIALLLAVLAACYVSSATATHVVCYFPNWSGYRSGAGKFGIDNVDPKFCTHMVYAFAVLDATSYTIQVYDSWIDIDNQYYSKFVALKQKKVGLKALIAIGGWNDSLSPKYSQMVADANKIDAFVNSVISFLQRYGFDGLDIDWEYPSSAADKAGMTKLLAALRKAFAPHGYLLTLAVSAGQYTIDAGYDVPSVNQYVDFINVMAYDLHGSWENVVDHHSPLYRRSYDSTTLNVDFGVNYWISKGMDRSKVVLGIPTYGRSWTLSSSSVVPRSPASGPGTQGSLTAEAGFLAYYEICNDLRSSSWQQVTTPGNLMGPYAYNTATKNWVGYDDISTVITKTKYVLDNELGGAMVWDISMDDFLNTCGLGVNPLMTAIASTINGSAPATSAPVEPSTSAPVVDARTTTTTTTTTTSAPIVPTTQSANNMKFTCPTSNGFFRNPIDCSSYYSCFAGMATLQKCPSGLYFNEPIVACDWPANVPCTA